MTPLQHRVFGMVRDILAACGSAPTTVSLDEQLGLETGTARRVVWLLIARGKLTTEDGTLRTLRLPAGPDLSSCGTDALRAELARRGETFDALQPRPVGMNEGRECAASACHERVEPGMLMCKRHWWQLPVALQRRIRSAFSGRNRAGYASAVRDAIDHVDHQGARQPGSPNGAWREQAR
jgi:hypothetical protein